MIARVVSSIGIDRKHGEKVDALKEVESFLEHINDDEIISLRIQRDNNETSLTQETLVIQGKDYRRCKYFND